MLAEEKRLDANGISLNLCKLEFSPPFTCNSITSLPIQIYSSRREKYVTKAEFDQLKSRYEQLEAFVRRNMPVGPAAAPSLPYYPMGVQPGMSGMMNESVSSYPPGASSTLVYSSAMMPPPPMSQPLYQASHAETTQSSQPTSNRYMRAEGAPQSPTRQSHHPAIGMLTQNTSPVMSTSLHGQSLVGHRGIESASPVSLPTVKTSPLSLASITSPYHPDQPQIPGQQKNYHAQTLILGERLRPRSEDPASFIKRVEIMPPAEVRAPSPCRFLQKEFQWRQPTCRYLPMPFSRRSRHQHIGLLIQPDGPWGRREGKEGGIVA